MAKVPKKDINLYSLVVAPKKNTAKKGVMFGALGIAAVVLMGGSYAAVRVYVKVQEDQVEELQEKANDPELLEKIAHANAVAEDINLVRTAGNAYSTIRLSIDSSRFYNDDFTEELIQQLISCETRTMPNNEQEQIATITALAYDGSTLSITANSPDSQYVSAFVTNLTHLNLFSDISYSGYALSNEVYTYTVNAVFVTHVYETTDAEGNPVETTTEVAQ